MFNTYIKSEGSDQPVHPFSLKLPKIIGYYYTFILKFEQVSLTAMHCSKITERKACKTGPSCSKLTMSLVNVSLKI